MGKSIGIVGGGIIGLTTAYYLTKAGHKVTILDKGSMNEGCSFGNAGMIVPSHFIPLAAPGMIAKGVKWMFNSKSPFYVRPRLSADLLRWGYLFYKSATAEKVAKAIPALKELSLFSRSCYQELSKELPFDFGYQERGLMMLYKTEEAEEEERETAHLAAKHGIDAHILQPEEIQKLEPDVRVNARGAVFFPGDAHLVPQLLLYNLKKHLLELGVNVVTNTEVVDFDLDNDLIQSVHTTSGHYSFDEIILATGSWSGKVGKKLSLVLPMQAGKGYSFTLEQVDKNIRIPSIFIEARVAITPMGNALRFGGTMEIVGVDHTINMNRVKGIVDSIPSYYPNMKVQLPSKDRVWHGLRPCTPDGLPYIGRVPNIKNLIVATGHAMLGLSLAPGTGKLVSEILDGGPKSVECSAFDANRFN